MKGILRKDFYALLEFSRIMLVFLALYICMDMAAGTNLSTSVIGVLFMIMPLNAMLSQQQCRWDAFARCLPISGRKQVLEKYLFTALTALFAAALGMGLSLLTGADAAARAELRQFFWFGLWGTLLLYAALWPLAYRFGVEKARYIFMAAVLLVLVGVMTALKMGVSFEEGAPLPLPWALPVTACVLYALSFALSCRIDSRQDK